MDAVELSNIGEGADIERIAHDVYFIWQTDKTRKDTYIATTTTKNKSTNTETTTESYRPIAGARARRLFVRDQAGKYSPRIGFMYVERLKAREGVTGLWGLLPYHGESGQIDATQTPGQPAAGHPDTVQGTGGDDLPY